MDISITDGLVLMPPPFADGLNVWSRGDGTAGSATYQGQADAALVPADQDFGGCLELQKTETLQKLRYMGQTPIRPGLYLRVTARVKAMSGNLPTLRIGAWAGDGAGHVAAAPAFGPQVVLDSYGTVRTITAIIGVGNRPGVDMVWGPQPTYGHFGIDLTGPNGGVVRIDDIQIEDVTDVFARKLMDWVDVRDYGAKGDGTTDDSAAFEAADAAAAGRSVLVSAGTYYLGSHVTFESRVRFEGMVTMPDTIRLALTRNYEINAYIAAFGSEELGFRKMLQALFYFTDHTVLDMGGRQIQIDAPVDVAAVADLSAGFATRRVICNGQLAVNDTTNWTTTSVTSQASYAPGSPFKLTSVANVAQIEVGSLVTGTGVGREVYVTAVNVGAGTVTISQPLWGAAGSQSYTFTRYRYMLDFSGMATLSNFEILDVEFRCKGLASAIMLAPSGTIFRVADCLVNKPRDRGITSIGTGCQGILIDRNQFLSNEQSLRSQDRTTIALNVNANDAKIRQNRVVRFAHFAVVHGSGHNFMANHFFQGDSETLGVRQAGVVLTQTNVATVFTGNYIDNCFIEWSNEHDPEPGFSNEYSFGGLSMTGNIFIASDVSAAFRWLVISPKGAGHYIQGLNVSGNVFRTFGGNIDRVDRLDDTVAGLDFGRSRNIRFEGNAFNGISQQTVNPVALEFSQNTASVTWTLDSGGYLPFGGYARNVQSLVFEGAVTDGAGAARHDFPYTQSQQGANKTAVALTWPVAVKGKVMVTMRVDNPN